MIQKQLPGLNQILLRLVLRRLFLPLLIVWIAAVIGAGYFLLQSLGYQQQQIVKAMTQTVDRHLDQGTRILDALAQVAENAPTESMNAFMQSTWNAYKHFDTIYYLDKNNKNMMMVPFDSMYLGLDMSDWSGFQNGKTVDGVTISRPFISMRTGYPTVYITRPIAQGGYMVGELNLGVFQQEASDTEGSIRRESIFILDQSGTLLAHPESDLVKQQTNMSYLAIFKSGLRADSTLIYDYQGKMVLGNAAPISRVGWVIVDQIPLVTLLAPYTLTFGITFLVTLGIWVALMWNLRKQLYRNVVVPLVQFSQSTYALAEGNYGKVSKLVSVPTAFAELNRLADDFQCMSKTLETNQTELKESEERYRNLFEEVPIGLFQFAPDGRILDVNQAYMEMLRFPNRETLLKAKVFELYSSGWNCEQWKIIVDHEKRENKGYLEIQTRRYDGTIIWVVIHWREVQDNESHILHYDGSMTDITEQKLAEEALQLAHDSLEIKVGERTRELFAANQELTAMNEEFIAMNEDINAANDKLSQVNNELQEENAERKRAEEELKNAQAQIIQQEKMASIGQLAAGVAHEINNPMGFIISNLASLKYYAVKLAAFFKAQDETMCEMVKTSTDERVNEIMTVLFQKFQEAKHLMKIDYIMNDLEGLVRETLDGADRVKTIVQDLKGFSRITDNESMLADINAGLESTINIIWNELKFKTTLVKEFGDIPLIKCNQGQLNQVFMNILVNAAQAIDMQGEVRIKTWAEDENIFVSIEDTGRGIPQDIINRIFEPFFTTKEVGKGTGLGLSVSYEIIKKHGGEITVDSVVGKGTTFTVKIPIVTE